MTRPLREGRAQRPHPLIVLGWPAGLAEWFVFQERELCPSFGLLVWNKYESSLISEWKNQSVLAPGSPDFGASCLPELSGKHTQAALHLDFWSCRMLHKKGSQWSHGSWACIEFLRLGAALFLSTCAPYLDWASLLPRQQRRSAQIHLKQACSLYYIELIMNQALNMRLILFKVTPNFIF